MQSEPVYLLESLGLGQEEKYREKLREQREGWEAAKKELQSSHEVQVQTLEATYQNQVCRGRVELSSG